MTRHFRRSRDYCDETCPAVDALANSFLDRWMDLMETKAERDLFASEFAALIEAIKEKGTIKLRDALCSCVGDLADAEDERDEFKQEAERLRDRVDELKDEIKELEAEHS